MSKSKHIEWRRAVAEVLGRHEAAMSPKEIVVELQDAGNCPWKGLTPWNSLASRVYVHIREEGGKALFVQPVPKKCLFALSEKGRAYLAAPGEGKVAIETGPAKPQREQTLAAPESTGLEPMTFLESAAYVLEHFGNGAPMHYLDITKKAQELGILASRGKTPEASMAAQLIVDIRKRASRGEPSRFIKCGTGLYALSIGKKSPLVLQIEQHNRDVKNELHERIKQMEPERFEELVSIVFECMGFEEVESTRYCKDGGIDVRGILRVEGVIEIKMAIQAKRVKSNIGRPAVDALRGCLDTGERGVFVTTSDFSTEAKKSAREVTKSNVIDLINGKDFVDLMVAHQVGIYRGAYDLLYLAENLTDIATSRSDN